MRARCVSGRVSTRQHTQDQAPCRAPLIRQNGTARHGLEPSGTDSIPLLKRVSQVRILPGAQH